MIQQYVVVGFVFDVVDGAISSDIELNSLRCLPKQIKLFQKVAMNLMEESGVRNTVFFIRRKIGWMAKIIVLNDLCYRFSKSNQIGTREKLVPSFSIIGIEKFCISRIEKER